jgi:ZIP family zinc transporter
MLDAMAPLLGVVSTYFYSLSQAHLGLVLALFCGFFLYIGGADLLPESHHRHPKRLTATLNVAGATLIWLTIHLAAF